MEGREQGHSLSRRQPDCCSSSIPADTDGPLPRFWTPEGLRGDFYNLVASSRSTQHQWTAAKGCRFTLPKSPLLRSPVQFETWPPLSCVLKGTPTPYHPDHPSPPPPQNPYIPTQYQATAGAPLPGCQFLFVPSRCELGPYRHYGPRSFPHRDCPDDPFQLRINRRPSAFSLHTQTPRPVTVNFVISGPSRINLDSQSTAAPRPRSDPAAV